MGGSTRTFISGGYRVSDHRGGIRSTFVIRRGEGAHPFPRTPLLACVGQPALRSGTPLPNPATSPTIRKPASILHPTASVAFGSRWAAKSWLVSHYP